MNITVEVTQADIDAGIEHDCDKCPIARALTRAIGKPVSVYVSSFRVWASRGLEARMLGKAYLPDMVSAFITQFDNAHPVYPFTFTVEVPWQDGSWK